MDNPTTADFSVFFEAPTLTLEVYEQAADAAHSSFRVREAFDNRLTEYGATGLNAEKHLRIGLGKLALSRHADALEHLAKAADGPLRYFFAAEALTAQGRFAQARQALAEAASRGMDPFVCDMLTIELLVREGDLAQAHKLVKKNESRGMDRGEWYWAQAILAEAELRREEAYELHQKALTLSPDNPRVMFRAAYLFDLLGSDDTAIDLYMRLTHRPRAQVNALINMAVIYEDRGQYEEAADCLRRVLRVFPNHTRARLFLKDVQSGIELIAEEGREARIDPRARLLGQSIADFELSVRARNCLKKMNIRTLGELIKLSEPELLAYKNFGETSLNEIKALLIKKGLRLGMQPEDVDAGVLAASQVTVEPKPATPRISVPPGREDMLSKPVAEMELSVRSRRCLQRLNVVTIGDLLNFSEADLLATRNFGQTSLNEIRSRLATLGLTLVTKR